MNDLEKLSRAVHEAPEGATWGAVVGALGNICTWGRGLTLPASIPMYQIIAKHERHWGNGI